MIEQNELPDGWVISDLISTTSHIIDGSHLPPAKQIVGLPMLSATNIENNIIRLEGRLISEQEFEAEHRRTRISAGDVLLTIVGTIGRSSVVPEGMPRFTLQRSVAVVRSTVFEPKFLSYQFQSPAFQKQLQKQARGTAQKGVYLKSLRELNVLVCNKNDQRRIVAKIEELFSDLDAGVAALERAKANLKRYRAAVLKAAVEGKLTEAWRAEHPDTEPASKLLERVLIERCQKWEADQLAKFAAAKKQPPKNWREKYVEPTAPDSTGLPELPTSWRWARLDQLLTYLRNGYFQSPSGAEIGTPILRINAVRPMSVDLSQTRFLEDIEGDVDCYFIRNGDLLFTRYNGSVDLLGVVGMVRGCMEKILHPDKLIRGTVAIGEPISSFVEIAANVGASRKHMAGRARTTAGQTGISGPDIREMPLPVPPLEEQRQIVAEVAEKLSQFESADVAIDINLIRATRLRQSILKQAFEGKLVPQDPNDEPASVLLERIRGGDRGTITGTSSRPRTRSRQPRLTGLDEEDGS